MLVIMADQSSGEYRQQNDRNSGGSLIAAAQEYMPHTPGHRYEEHRRVVLEPKDKGTQAACMYCVTS